MREQLYRVLIRNSNRKFFLSAHTEKRPITLEQWQGLVRCLGDMYHLLITEEHYQRWWKEYLTYGL